MSPILGYGKFRPVGVHFPHIRRRSAYSRNISLSIASSVTCKKLRELGSHQSSICLGLNRPPKEAPCSFAIPFYSLDKHQSALRLYFCFVGAFHRNGTPQTLVYFIWLCVFVVLFCWGFFLCFFFSLSITFRGWSTVQLYRHFVFIAGYPFTEEDV